MWKTVPDEATFSRAFDEFAKAKLPERVHEALIKNYLGDTLIGHISRDGTAIAAREKPAKKHRRRCPTRAGNRVGADRAKANRAHRK